MSIDPLYFPSLSFILGDTEAGNIDKNVPGPGDQQSKKKKEESWRQHFKERMAAVRAFKEITFLYKWSFTSASAYRLNEMVKCLEYGFKICNNKEMYERWAFEVMPGCLKSLQKKERRKNLEDRNMSVTSNVKTDLFQKYSEPLAVIINSLEKNEITHHSAKTILRELISNPAKKVEILLESYTANKDKEPASKEDVHYQVKLFLENIDVYFLGDRIEKLMYRYFYHSKREKCRKSTLQIFRDVRKILKDNNIVSLIRKQDKDRFSDISKNIQVASKYYQTTAEGIQNLLNECLKLNDMPLPKDIFRYSFNGCARAKINFFCQPIMEALNFKTTGKAIMEEFDSQCC